MKVLITGANGFLGKNLKARLESKQQIDVITFTRENNLTQLNQLIKGVDFIFHLAGVNRPNKEFEYEDGNVRLTSEICNAVEKSGREIPILFTSSTQALQDNSYGKSKCLAEVALLEFKKNKSNQVYIFRLPNMFGKWCRPNYNSVVATFCHNISRGLPIKIDNPKTSIDIMYVEDLMERMIDLMEGADSNLGPEGFEVASPQYSITVGELANLIYGFQLSRSSLVIERVGVGLLRALYSTYLSYLPTNSFSYPVQQHEDYRGRFVEFIKTPDCGQISYITINQGQTRGGHFHNVKTEKFLVIKGSVLFKFRNILSGEAHEIISNNSNSEIIETIPGWAHDITNIGESEALVILWANEIFDPNKPDTFSSHL